MTDAIVLTGHAVPDLRARDRAIASARAGWLGRMARALGIYDLLDDIYDDQREVELALYRKHHARAATAASPLALDLLAHDGLDVDALVSALRPRADWRRWVCGVAPPVEGPFGRWSVGAAHPCPQDKDEMDLFLHGCSIAREWGDPAGARGVRLSPAGLEVGARIGPAHLRTIDGVATITTAVPIPDAIKVASLGQPVEQVFDHPVLRDRGYVIAEQYDRVPTASDPREAWRIEFHADPVPWRVPWARTRSDHVGRDRGHHGGDDVPTWRTPDQKDLR